MPCKDEDDVSASSDSLGEQLFELVDVYNTGHSQKITGKRANTECYAAEYDVDVKLLRSNVCTLNVFSVFLKQFSFHFGKLIFQFESTFILNFAYISQTITIIILHLELY